MGIKNLFIRGAKKEEEKEDSLTQIKKEVEQRSKVVKSVTDNVDRLNEELLESLKTSAEEHSKKR